MAKVIKIVSGGQTGADRGALDWAIAAGVPHGGWCPKARRCEEGRIPERYALKEAPSSHYLDRTVRNITESDATLIFSFVNSPGTVATIRFCRDNAKPYLVVEDRDPAVAAVKIKAWVESLEQPEITLNVAGHRETVFPTISTLVYQALNGAIS